MIWITAKTWRNSYLTIGNQRTLKNSKSYLNMLRVFQREIEKLAKVRRKSIAKERSSPNAYNTKASVRIIVSTNTAYLLNKYDTPLIRLYLNGIRIPNSVLIICKILNAFPQPPQNSGLIAIVTTSIL